MGDGPTQTTNQSGNTQPWAPAVPQLQGLLGQLGSLNNSVTPNQAQAGNSLWNGASGLSSFAPQASGAANNLLGGGGASQFAPMFQGAYGNLQGSLSGLANPGNLNPYSTPGFGSALSTLNSDISNQIGDRFAAAGRSGSPGETTALARGLSQGEGQLVSNQYNQNASNLMGASNSLFGAGFGTGGALSNLNQLGNSNMLAGAGLAGQIPGLALAPGQAQFGAANAQQGLPFANLQNFSSLLTPLAKLGQQNTQNQTQQTQVPPWQQALQIGASVAPFFI